MEATQMILIIIETLAAIGGITALILNIYKHPLCWKIWLVVDIVLATINWHTGHPAQAMLWVAYGLACLWGMRQWKY
jgi:nicotinamide riboside transporter PnuC